MDEEGYFSSQGQRIEDEDFGRSLLLSLTRHETGTFLVNSAGTWAVLEAFDEPLVVQNVEAAAGEEWKILLPYGVEQKFPLNSLRLDDGDRFHGRNLQGLPFVFSRKAQAQFFNLLDGFEDEAFTVNGRRYETPFWLGEEKNAEAGQEGRESFWTEIYRTTEKPPWDQDGPALALPSVLPQLKIPKSRVLVLGCGRGHDAAFFAQQGHIVTGVDISPLALDQARERYSALKDLQFHQQDLFQLPENWRGQFDIVFEHTCYCAIPPRRRNDLVKVWKQMLAPGGHMLGVFFVMDKPVGPPFGGSEWELRERLKNHFEFLYWTRWHKSHPRRQGRELVVYAQKS
jgi:SAM-dependent methyltransferase